MKRSSKLVAVYALYWFGMTLVPYVYARLSGNIDRLIDDLEQGSPATAPSAASWAAPPDTSVVKIRRADTGLTVDYSGGIYRVRGTTTDMAWGDEGIARTSPLDSSCGAKTIEGDFLVVKHGRSGVAYLGGTGAVILLLEWSKEHPKGIYCIQTRFLGIDARLEKGRLRVPAELVNVDAFNTLGITVSADRRHVSYYVNKHPIGTLLFRESVPDTRDASLCLQTPVEGHYQEIYFKDLRMRCEVPGN